MRVNKPERKVPRTSQLGAIQTALLEWLLTREEEISVTGTEQEKLVLEARGVPWNVKQFSKCCEKACKNDGTPDRSKVSTSLSGLERRELVIRRGVRTAHVKLTGRGRAQVLAKRADPRSWQEKKTIDHARHLAGNISFYLHRYGDGILIRTQHEYIEVARLTFHLLTLKEHGELRPGEEKELALALRLLQSVSFEHLLTIAQEADTYKHHAAELRGLHEKLQSEMFTFT